MGVPKADCCWYMTENHKYCKAITLQLKKQPPLTHKKNEKEKASSLIVNNSLN